MYWCQGNSLVSGDETGRFNPVDYTRRSEAASVFVRYVKLAGTLPPAPPEEDPQEPPESSTPEENPSAPPQSSTPEASGEDPIEPTEGEASSGQPEKPSDVEGQPDENGQEQPSDGATGEALENTNEPTLKAGSC